MGVLKCKVDLHEKGYIILNPETEHAPFDVVAYKDNKFLRIQVKYRTVVDDCVEVKFRSSWNDKNGCHVQQIDKLDIDLICVFINETNKCYYVDPKKFNTGIKLRVRESKNKHSESHYIENFLEIPVLD